MAHTNCLWVLPAPLSLQDSPFHLISLVFSSFLFLVSISPPATQGLGHTATFLLHRREHFKSWAHTPFLGISSLRQMVCLISWDWECPQGLCSVSCYTASWTHFLGTEPPHPAVSKAAFPTIWLKWDSQRLLSSSQLCPPSGQFIHSAHWNVKAQMGNEPVTQWEIPGSSVNVFLQQQVGIGGHGTWGLKREQSLQAQCSVEQAHLLKTAK